MACGIPLPQETPASTTKLEVPNFAHFGARVAQPVVLAPAPVGAAPIVNAAPVPAPALLPIPANIQQIVALHRAELTPYDLMLADPNTHSHPLGAHPGLPIHPGYDKPHSHAPFNQHPVVDMKTGAIVSEPQTSFVVNQALRLAPPCPCYFPCYPLDPCPCPP